MNEGNTEDGDTKMRGEKEGGEEKRQGADSKI